MKDVKIQKNSNGFIPTQNCMRAGPRYATEIWFDRIISKKAPHSPLVYLSGEKAAIA